MTSASDVRGLQARMERLDTLLRAVEQSADPAVQAQTREIVQVILDLHAAGLERFMEHVTEAGEAGRAVLDTCVRDDLVAGMLLLHGLHPLDLEARVREALAGVRPFLRSHSGNVELLGVEGGIVRLRLEGSCDGCPSSAVTMKHTIEEAILRKAPDANAIEVEGMTEPPSPMENRHTRVALTVLV